MELPNKKYKIIYADPPWKYIQDKKSDNFRAVTSQYYKTMTTEEICNLDVQSICKEKAVCFLWVTFPNIEEGLKVMKAWGFEYKTVAFVWIKKNKKSNTNAWGMGFYTRSNAEICLLGLSKGTKAMDIIKSHSVHQIIESVRREHSRKPDEVRKGIVKLCGNNPRIELFARQRFDGWDSWGNEVPKECQNVLIKEQMEEKNK
jgi:site-specific DNA-methyltransferase (adenine-specific)